MLAHGAAATQSPSLALLIGGGVLFVAGAVGLLAKRVGVLPGVSLLVLGLAGAGGALAFSEGGPDPTITLVSPAEGASVPVGEPVPLEVHLDGGTLIGFENPDAAPEDAGHLHVYISGQIVAMDDELNPEITFEEPGTHELLVEFVSADHQQFDPPVTDTAMVTAA